MGRVSRKNRKTKTQYTEYIEHVETDQTEKHKTRSEVISNSKQSSHYAQGQLLVAMSVPLFSKQLELRRTAMTFQTHKQKSE